MADEQVNHLAEGKLLGPSPHQGQVDYPEVGLQRGVGEKLVEDHLGDDPLTQLDDNAHALAVGLVTQIADSVDLVFLDQVGDAHDQVGLVDLIRQFGDDDLVLAAFGGFQGNPGPHHDLAPSRTEGLHDALRAENDPRRGEIRAFDDLQQLLKRQLRVVDHGHDGPGDLGQVVRRHVGGHAHRDAAGAVDQQEREGRGQNQRLLERIVVVGAEIHGLLVDVAQHGLGDPGQAGLRVAHGRRGVPVDGAEVALAVDHRVAQGEVLGQAHQGLVDRRVPVGVVLAQHVSDDAAALLEGPVVAQAHLLHSV